MSSNNALRALLSFAALIALEAIAPKAAAHPPAKDATSSAETPATPEDSPASEPRQTDKPDVWTGNGFAFHLSGGLAMVTPSLSGGGAMLALTFEQGGFGFGAYGSGVGASSEEEVDGERRSAFGSVVSGGGLVHWTPGEGLVLPLLELGLGYGSLGLADEQSNIHKGKGAMLMLRAGIASHKTGLFVALRIDAPLFKAEDTRGNTDARHGVGITAETGFRFGG